MNVGKLVFAQITQHLPLTTFRRCVARYGGEHKVKTFSCLDQYLCMAFAQLTYRESLRPPVLLHVILLPDASRPMLLGGFELWVWRVFLSCKKKPSLPPKAAEGQVCI